MENKNERVLNSKGSGVWDTVVARSVPSKKKSKFAAQKKAKKNNVVAFKTIFNGLLGSIKKIIGKCTSAKDLWMKLEKVYQDKRQDIEDNPIKEVKQINEGEDPPKYSDCNDSKCNDVECSPANK
jgi:hypothetical protein